MAIFPAILALAATSVPHLAATRVGIGVGVEKAPIVDGRLDDAAWRTAAASDAFTQKLPEDGKAPLERTVVKILYDDDAIYVGIDCVQRRSEVIGRLTRRDRNVEADQVGVIIDTRSDGKTAFEFSVNPAGVISDGLHFNDTDYTQDWDENWEAKTASTPEGWSAELRIPLRALRFGDRKSQSWGLQVRRYTSETQELDEWAYIPRETAGEVSHYGRLDGLVGLRSKSPFELRPFVVGVLRHHDPASTVLARGFEPLGSIGVDVKWHISQELTLDGTFFPDFGQVEADQVILNLTTFEQYYPEKRPFFLEGAETFSLPLALLYTRRIGRAPAEPALRADAPFREQLFHEPTPSTIYGAAKLVGEIGGHFSVGELVAVTGRQAVEIEDGRGKRSFRMVDPLSTYKVFRLKREIGDNAHIGLIAMATNRLEEGADYPLVGGPTPPGTPRKLCPTGDELRLGERCFHDAYVGGLDARWRSSGGDYVVNGQAIATLIQGGPERVLLDGTTIRSGDVGPAGNLSVAKESGKVTFRAEYNGHGRKVDYNDLGYMQRQNLHSLFGQVAYRTLEPFGATLETRTALTVNERDTLDGQNQYRSFAVANFTRYKNFWGVWAEAHYRPAHYDDREMGDGAALERPGLFGLEAYAATDSRKRVYVELWSQVHFIDQAFGFQGDGKLSFRVLPQFDVDLLPTWVYATGEPRYVGTENGAYLFGRQRAQSLGLTLRSTYTFTPQLTLQAYAQLFLDAGHYSDFSSSPANGKGTVVHLADLRPLPGAPATNPNFQSGTLNASLVLRWEYRLGSTLYVVYTHAQNNQVTPSWGDDTGFDFRRVTPRAAEDDLLVKLSYWWGG